MREIPLTNSDLLVKVDDEDYEAVCQVPWHLDKAGYAVTSTQTLRFREMFGHLNIATQKVLMHRLLLNPAPDVEVDHEFGNTLDNRKGFLRLATSRQNSHNSRSHVDAVSRYKGVTWDSKLLVWRAQLSQGKRCIYLGCHASEVKAALAYDRKARELHGSFARLNFPENPQKTLPSQEFVSAAGYVGVSCSGARFRAAVTPAQRRISLGTFETAYDAALYRDYYIEKHNLTLKMNF